MKKIRAIIVDDEEPGRRNLESLLSSYCPEVELSGLAASAVEARNLVESVRPELVFLDINMPNINGFEFLELFSRRSFLVIFVTAHAGFGIQAVKANALDYLLKPISITELQAAIKKVSDKIRNEGYLPPSAELPEKLAVSHLNGFEIVETDDIIRLEADDNYTTIYTVAQGPIVVSRTIKDFEVILDPERFIRIHKTHIINIRHLKKYSKKDGGMVTLSDATELAIAKRRHGFFMEKVHRHLLTMK
ncbi:MAG: response regulator transcription factor [Bacteroidales bacterium]|nr:response regulator transcription factor [Bacteroidales bacterium]